MKNKILITAVALVVIVLAIFLFSRIRCTLGGRNMGSALELYNHAVGMESQGELLSAKNDLQKLIDEFPNFKLISEAQKKLEDINLKVLFSSLATAQTKAYEVKPGDSLDKIARAFNTTVELIKRSNNLSANVIRPGQKIRLWTEKFSILVDKSQNTLILKSGDEIIKTYRVSTGLNSSTPVGTFKITSKLINPPWFKAGAVVPPESPENVLGSRWMGFDLPGYGIHGTIQPETIGQQITAGCVRMRNSDVEEIYSIVPQGTEVTIVD